MLKFGCASEITFLSMLAALRIMGAMIFISLLHDDALLPLTVWHVEMKQVSMANL